MQQSRLNQIILRLILRLNDSKALIRHQWRVDLLVRWVLKVFLLPFNRSIYLRIVNFHRTQNATVIKY